MKLTRTLSSMTIWCIVWTLPACVGDEFDVPNREEVVPKQVSSPEKIRSGRETWERPEIGELGGCTATLVAQDVAITASHCLGYGTRRTLGRYMTLTLTRDGRNRNFTVDRYRSFGRGLGTYDVALVGLEDPVPVDFARAAPLAEFDPPDGTMLSVYGYGCTRIGRGDWDRKRKAQFRQGERSSHLCPGDSGGPVFDDRNGHILRINSGYNEDRARTDIHGHVPTLYDELRAQVVAWSVVGLPEVIDGPLDDSHPEEINTPLELDDARERCGFDYEIFRMKTCTNDRNHLYHCPEDGEPTWELCPHGCVSKPAGEHDVCAEAGHSEGCPPEYRDDVYWTCASDGYTLFRCNQDIVETRECRRGCRSLRNRPDRCRLF